MSKAILLSIKPKYVADILNGKKTIEVRKVVPKCDLPIDVYIYCTKEQEIFYTPSNNGKRNYFVNNNRRSITRLSNGVVVAKFTLRKVEEINVEWGDTYYTYRTKSLEYNKFFDKSCLELFEVDDYLQRKKGYAWHIEDLVVFDKPKELSDFYKWCEPFEINKGCGKVRWEKSLTKAPQSMCYIYIE